MTPSPDMDPLVRALTSEGVQRDIKEFRRFLDAKASERVIHKFLANHSYFFNRLIRLDGSCPLYSKIELGSDYEIDFAFFDSGSNGPEWILIEIESPSKSLFTKSGNPSAHLTHAMQQIRNWQSWIQDHSDYARKPMPLIEFPLGCIFMGRRNEITQEGRKLLRRLRYECRQYLEIHSLDWFIDSARTVVGGGWWRLPMRALSYTDLKKGLPSNARRYIQIFADGGPHHEYPAEIIRDREWKYQPKLPFRRNEI